MKYYRNCYKDDILLTKTTASRNEGALSYLRVRGMYFLAVVFVVTIVMMDIGHAHAHAHGKNDMIR